MRAALSKVIGQFNDPRGLQKTGPTGAGRTRGTDSPLGISQALDIDRGDDRALAEAIINECFDGVRNALNGMSIAQVVAENQCASDVRREARQIAGLTRQNKGRQIEGIRSVIRAMSAAGGIRHLVLISDGLPVSREVDDLHPLARAAAAAGVQLSVLMADPDISLTDEGRGESMNAPDRTQTDMGTSERRREDNALHLTGLQTMTDMLGGTFHRVVGNVDPFFDRVLVASSAVYRLGVEIPSGGKPGDVFEVSVSVKRPGVKARANRFSVADTPVPSAPSTAARPAPPVPAPSSAAVSLDDMAKRALERNAPASDIPIRIAAYQRKSASVPGQVDVSVTVAIPASAGTPLNTYIGVVDAKRAMRSSGTVLHAPESGDYEASFMFPLPPGEYRIRYAAANERKQVGTIELPLSVKLEAMGGLTASDLLTWYVEDNKAKLFAIEDIPPGLDSLRVSLEMYPTAGVGVETPSVRWSIAPEGGQSVESLESAAQVTAGVFRADASFGVAELAPGRYVLRADVVVNGQVVGTRAAVLRKS